MTHCELVHASVSTQTTNESRDIDIRPLVFKSGIHKAGEKGQSRPPGRSNVAESFIYDEDEGQDEEEDDEEFNGDDEEEVGEEIEEIGSEDVYIEDEEDGA